MIVNQRAKNLQFESLSQFQTAKFHTLISEQMFFPSYLGVAHLNGMVLAFHRSPPEVILQGLYSHVSDVWSFGVLAWELYTAFTNGVSSRDQTLPYFDLSNDEVTQCANNCYM